MDVDEDVDVDVDVDVGVCAEAGRRPAAFSCAVVVAEAAGLLLIGFILASTLWIISSSISDGLRL